MAHVYTPLNPVTVFIQFNNINNKEHKEKKIEQNRAVTAAAAKLIVT